MRKFAALCLALALLLGCFGLAAFAADTDPYRVVGSFADENGRTLGLHWYTKADSAAVVKIDGVDVAGRDDAVYKKSCSRKAMPTAF